MTVKTTKPAVKKVVKKAVKKPKKAVSQKVVAKKVSSEGKKGAVTRKKQTALRSVRILQPGEYFWLVNGGGLESLEALAEALELMSEEQFAYHTRRDGNDFARWIEGVFAEEELARMIARQKTQEACAEILHVYLKK